MRKKTFSRFLQGAVSMVMVASMLTGCGGSAASTSSSNASAETATTAADNVEYKDTLIVGEYGDSDSLDPQKNVSHDKIERELYEGLLEIDPDTGEIIKAYIFVGVMTYSQYAYVEAFLDMKQRSWINAHVHMYDSLAVLPGSWFLITAKRQSSIMVAGKTSSSTKPIKSWQNTTAQQSSWHASEPQKTNPMQRYCRKYLYLEHCCTPQ